MIYGSVCSGIEAATMAWHPLGWSPAFFAEIEKFPSAVLAHHYGSNMPGQPLAKNGIPNYGDFTKIGADAGPIDLLVGGTPCQSFSVAGKRLGLDDPRGNLALEYLSLARRLRARWLVWENVPGVLSSVTDEEDGESDLRSGLKGREAGDEWIEESDFATFLSFVRECGYGFAYRVLDAQYVRVDGYGRAVPQRRRRMFVVGYLGDWRRAAAVLLEPQGMRGDSAPRREAGKGVAPTIASRPTGGGGLGTDFDLDGGLIASTGGVSHCLNAGGMGRQDYETETLVAHTLRAEGFDASEDGTGRGVPIVPVAGAICRDSFAGGAGGRPEGAAAGHFIPVAFDCKASGRSGFGVGEISPTLRAMGHKDSHSNAGGQVAVAIQAGALRENPNSGPDGVGVQEGIAYTLESRAEVQAVQSGWAVRRLTPRECERLQGFPDDFTDIPWRGKDAAPDGPRYKALGNSMAVNVMRWIGRRIEMVEGLNKEDAA